MTIEKVKQIASEKYGKNLTNEQAATYVDKYGKLSDNELDNVSGGGCDAGVNDPLGECPTCGTQLKDVVDTGFWCENCRKFCR